MSDPIKAMTHGHGVEQEAVIAHLRLGGIANPEEFLEQASERMASIMFSAKPPVPAAVMQLKVPNGTIALGAQLVRAEGTKAHIAFRWEFDLQVAEQPETN